MDTDTKQLKNPAVYLAGERKTGFPICVYPRESVVRNLFCSIPTRGACLAESM
jgi:hypothetical protein